MAKQSDHLNLNDRQKTGLLSLALDANSQEARLSDDERRGDLLCDVLRCPLAGYDSGSDASPDTERSQRSGPPLVCGPSIRELLGTPETDVSILRHIKEYGKALGARARPEVEKDVFLAVYFAAIAAALAFRGERITEHTDKDLSRFFRDFANAEWMTTDLTRLFEKAAECCREVERADNNLTE